MPVTCYRMGRPRHGVPRLLKIVLPARKFQSLLLKRAPRLRFFPVKGVFIRPSLTWEERVQRRANITSPHQSAPPKEVSAHNVSLQSSSSHHSAADPPCPMQMFQSSFSIAAITETWLKQSNDITPLLGAGAYNIIRCDRTRRKGGRVAILLSKELQYTAVFSESVPNSYEILACDLIPLGSPPVRLILSFLDLCSNYGYLQLVKSPTRQGNILDLILCNDHSLISDVAIHAPIGTSDHCSLSAALQSRHVRRSLTYCLDYRKY
ncbi:hypothetical protein COOONC_01590 [Cooperia oncophora]